ncbi:MAG: hypothetical protein ACTTKH_01940 [Treponema sp.]
MGCKKLFFVSFYTLIFSLLFSAKNYFAVSPVFIMHSLHTKVQQDESKITEDYKKLIRSSSDDIYKTHSYSFGLSLDLNADFLYFSFQFAFPENIQTTFLNFSPTLSKYRSVISDLQVGLTYKTFENKPYNLLFQLGLGFGATHFSMKGNILGKGEVDYTKTDMMLGLGGNIVFTYAFHKIFGMYFGIGDMLYFMNIRTYRLFEFTDDQFIFEEKLKSENFNAVNTFANSLNVKMGVSFFF